MKYVSTTLEALQEEHQNALNDAQSEMMAVLGEAQNSGDFSKMQEISESFQKTSMLLMEAFEDCIRSLQQYLKNFQWKNTMVIIVRTLI